MKLSKNFNTNELFSPALYEQMLERGVNPRWYLYPMTLPFLEALRENFGKPVLINHGSWTLRGICTNEENKRIGRNLTSMHNFQAFDINVKDVEIKDVRDWILANADEYGVGGFGYYEARGFVHVDFRQSDGMVKWEE